MKLKMIVSAALCLAMTAAIFTGCAEKNNNGRGAKGSAEISAQTPEMSEMRDISSMELVSEMKLGWNLGNTLDSTIQNPKAETTVEDWETAWGQPVTTKKMIDSVKAQGFNVLRVPVTWEGKFGEAPDYKINADWIARVKEIVNYGIENDMFVILNMHHEEWHMPTAENKDTADQILRALWKQIAEEFADYNEMLIFEGMNEPRLKGTPLEWNGGNEESREIINVWNSSFVETVRATGGNNAIRHLMIPGYAASSSANVLKSIKVPENDDKIIVSVHAYLPYSFALADTGSSVSEWSEENPADTRDIDNLFAQLKDLFIDKGQAVIIGEFGSRNRMNTEARTDCAGYYIEKATEAGVPCIWWDNNAFVGSGENFGLFDRKTFEWRYPDIITAMVEATEENAQ